MKRQLNIPYDIVPATGRNTLAIPFNVPTWTGTWLLAGGTSFSSNFQNIWNLAAMADIEWATITVSLYRNTATPSKARLRTMHYDASGQQVWEPLGAEMVQNSSNNPNAITIAITDELNALRGRTQRNIGLEVMGNGSLYMARLGIMYGINDVSAEYAALAARVSQLEQSGVGVPGPAGPAGSLDGPLSETQLQQIADDMRNRMAT
jgi:hypothetical protein